jgi:hypothetical protein
MSVDDRIRRGLRANAESLYPEVESALPRVRWRRRRTRVRNWTASVAAVAAVVAGSAILVDHVRSTPPPPAHRSGGLVGDYNAIAPQGSPQAGGWQVAFGADGRLTIRPPAAYHGIVSGALFSSTATTFRTNLFGEDKCSGDPVGSYTWHRKGPRLLFMVVDDPCDARTAFFSGSRWTRSGG